MVLIFSSAAASDCALVKIAVNKAVEVTSLSARSRSTLRRCTRAKDAFPAAMLACDSVSPNFK